MKHVSSGQKLSIAARDWNKIIDASRYVSAHQPLFLSPSDDDTHKHWLYLRNDTNDTVPVYGAMKLLQPMRGIDPAQRRPTVIAFDGYSLEENCRFAVIQQTAGPGRVVKAVTEGITPVRVKIVDLDHLYAKPAEEPYALVSSEHGPMELLWKPPEIGQLPRTVVCYGKFIKAVAPPAVRRVLFKDNFEINLSSSGYWQEATAYLFDPEDPGQPLQEITVYHYAPPVLAVCQNDYGYVWYDALSEKWLLLSVTKSTVAVMVTEGTNGSGWNTFKGHIKDNEDAEIDFLAYAPQGLATALFEGDIVFLDTDLRTHHQLLPVCINPPLDAPIGTIRMMYKPGLILNPPKGWHFCDGENGTPDLRDVFIRGTPFFHTGYDSGGNERHNHPDHAVHWHEIETTTIYYQTGSVPCNLVTAVQPVGAGAHEEASHLPPYQRLAFIMRTH